MGPENGLISELRKALVEAEPGTLLLVGGSVRDLILGRPLIDYDFLWDGDFSKLTDILTARLNCKPVLNDQLLTASYQTTWGRLDLSRARAEIYLQPGSLPKVKPTSWQEDLSRRDFTINTLALPLTLDGWGTVVDDFGGQCDLRKCLIRVLHPLSFQDDPTRILRGIRLKNRLGFNWDEETLACLERAWPNLELVSPARRFKEWQLLCQEEYPAKIFREIFDLGGWDYCFAGLPYRNSWGEDLTSGLPLIHGFRRWLFLFLILLCPPLKSAEELLNYWGIPPRIRQNINQALFLGKLSQDNQARSRRLFLQQLQKLPIEGLYFVYYTEFQNSTSWEDFRLRVKNTRPPIKGRDLLKLGFAPGKEMGKLLQQLEEKFWQEEYSTKEEGLSLVQQVARESVKED